MKDVLSERILHEVPIHEESQNSSSYGLDGRMVGEYMGCDHWHNNYHQSLVRSAEGLNTINIHSVSRNLNMTGSCGYFRHGRNHALICSETVLKY